jgi:hypothetical protein
MSAAEGVFYEQKRNPLRDALPDALPNARTNAFPNARTAPPETAPAPSTPAGSPGCHRQRLRKNQPAQTFRRPAPPPARRRDAGSALGRCARPRRPAIAGHGIARCVHRYGEAQTSSASGLRRFDPKRVYTVVEAGDHSRGSAGLSPGKAGIDARRKGRDRGAIRRAQLQASGKGALR